MSDPKGQSVTTEDFGHMTCLEFACLVLRHPRSGTEWLDRLIEQAKAAEKAETTP